MNVRAATTADEQALRELWEEFELEVPEPPGTAPETWEEGWADVRKDMAGRYPKHQWPTDPANATPHRLK